MSPRPSALLTVSIGPVHGFIVQARRVADQWAASRLLSDLVAAGVEQVRELGGEMVIPVCSGEIPRTLPNRFIARVPMADSGSVAAAGHAVERAIRHRWAYWTGRAADLWESLGQRIDPRIWHRGEGYHQSEAFLEVAWSWVPEGADYAAALAAGVERYGGLRHFRSFGQRPEYGEKCPLCGERTSLPDGHRHRVREAWADAEASAHEMRSGLGVFFREGQGRLCLVCLTKRLYPWLSEKRAPAFGDFESIGSPEAERRAGGSEPGTASGLPYFALVSLDGDKISRLLTLPPKELTQGSPGLKAFHRDLSARLTAFASSLRIQGSPELRLADLDLAQAPERSPQLVYAGGEDVVFYCHPRDAFPLAQAVRKAFCRAMAGLSEHLKPADMPTISAGVLFAHARRPAGQSFADAQRLLDEQAKAGAGRDAVALRLHKRSGRAAVAAFGWDSPYPLILSELSRAVRDRRLASRTTYRFREEEETLRHVFGTQEALWRQWLARRLSVSGEVEEEEVRGLAELLAPCLAGGHPEVLRLARFLGREVPVPAEESVEGGAP